MLPVVQSPPLEEVAGIRGRAALRDQTGGPGFQGEDAPHPLVLRGLDMDFRNRDEDLVQDARALKRREDHCPALTVQVAHVELVEEALVRPDEPARFDPLLTSEEDRVALSIAPFRTKTACSGVRRDDDRRELRGVEDRGVEVQTTRLGVDNLEGKAALPLQNASGAPPSPSRSLIYVEQHVCVGVVPLAHLAAAKIKDELRGPRARIKAAELEDEILQLPA